MHVPGKGWARHCRIQTPLRLPPQRGRFVPMYPETQQCSRTQQQVALKLPLSRPSANRKEFHGTSALANQTQRPASSGSQDLFLSLIRGFSNAICLTLPLLAPGLRVYRKRYKHECTENDTHQSSPLGRIRREFCGNQNGGDYCSPHRSAPGRTEGKLNGCIV